jgi:hypothetical protein
MKGGFETAFGDWPQAQFLEGEQALHITGKYRAPSWWWQAGFPVLLGIVFLIGAPVSCSSAVKIFTGREIDTGAGGDAGGIYLAGCLVLYFIIIAWGGLVAARRTLSIKLSAEAIQIGNRRYARSVPHQYAIEEHEKAHDEESAARRGHGKDRIFRDAMQVVMRYGERRVPIAAFGRRDVRKAEALLVRLQLLDQGLEELLETAAQGEAAAPGEGDDFGPARPIR